ncbi:MAG: DUF177 domain-containing protein [bacterium]
MDSRELNLNESKFYNNLRILKTKVKLIKKALGVNADFNVGFSADFVCARCLTTFEKKFDENLHLIYIAGKDPLLDLEKVELKSGDIDRVYYTGPNIDISIGIRETIILAIPSAPLCRNDCQGLCPICGKNLNEEKCGCKTQRVGLFTPPQKYG